MKIGISKATLENGTHIRRNVIAQTVHAVVEIPDSECMEVRVDWGKYDPVVTFPAIEKALKARGYLDILHLKDNEQWFYYVAK